MIDHARRALATACARLMLIARELIADRAFDAFLRMQLPRPTVD